MVAVAHPVPVRAQLLRARLVDNNGLWLAEWRDADGTLLAGLYRETCVELWRGASDERHRPSTWGGRQFETLVFEWSLGNDEIEALTRLELAELPRDLHAALVEIAFDSHATWSRAARDTEVRL